jgi:hypothetical protein
MDWFSPGEAILYVEPGHILDEFPRLLLGFPLRIAPLQNGYDRDVAAILITLDYDRELVDLHTTNPS